MIQGIPPPIGSRHDREHWREALLPATVYCVAVLVSVAVILLFS